MCIKQPRTTFILGQGKHNEGVREVLGSQYWTIGLHSKSTCTGSEEELDSLGYFLVITQRQGCLMKRAASLESETKN